MVNENAKLVVVPVARHGGEIIVRGSGWSDCPVEFAIDGKRVAPLTVPVGSRVEAAVRPDPRGELVVYFASFDLEPGVHSLLAASRHANGAKAEGRFELQQSRIQKVKDEEVADSGGPPRQRKWINGFFAATFGPDGYMPEGFLLERARELAAARQRKLDTGAVLRIAPVAGVCNWAPLGAGPAVSDEEISAGRVNGVCVHPSDGNTAYVASAGGGIWKTINAGVSWDPVSDFEVTLCTKCVVLDPHDATKVYAGTGVEGYGGHGILRSDDSGGHWTIDASFDNAIVHWLAFDTSDLTSHHRFAATSHGLFETIDGLSWPAPLRAGICTDVKVINGLAGAITVVAAFQNEGLFRGTKTAGTWGPITAVSGSAIPSAVGVVSLTQCALVPRTLYAAFAEPAGMGVAAIARSDDGGGSWNPVDVRFDTTYHIYQSADATGHSHDADIPTPDVLAAPTAHVYTTTSAGSPAHTHAIHLTAADIRTLGHGGSLTVTSDATMGHTHSFFLQPQGQVFAHSPISVHPTDPNIVFFGSYDVFRNRTGGGVFTHVAQGIHVDQHAIVFDPSNPNNVWLGNDGGVFRTTNLGDTVVSRNDGLSTMQYVGLACHPTAETILLAGAQDNGVQRCTGSEVWWTYGHVDGGVTAIDPHVPNRMFQQSVGNNQINRSVEAGKPGSWIPLHGITGGTPAWVNALVCDALTPNVLYFGNTRLWRSDAAGDDGSWTQLTPDYGANIGSIVVHPANAGIVFFATASHIYRLERTSSWTMGGVTISDLGAPSSMGVSLAIGSIAVEASGGAVWACTPAHVDGLAPPRVFRWDGSSWVPRSGGIPPTQSGNSLLLDPTSDMRLFCATDSTVWRTDDNGMSWVPWDHGLPTAFMVKLALGPNRLLRVATYGRGVWERPIDTTSCPQVALYIRDNVLDNGRVTPSIEGVPNPLDPTQDVWHWQSIDIKVDAEEGSPPAFQTPAPVADSARLAANVVHRNPRRGRTNRFYAQIHNRGWDDAHNVRVRGFFTDAHAGLQLLPSDFWSMGRPFTGTPSGTIWTAVGTTHNLGTVRRGAPKITEWDFFVPTTANEHSCLFVVVTCDETPLAGAGVFDADLLVRTFKQVALKNLHVVNMPTTDPATAPPDDALVINIAGATLEALTAIDVHSASLPKDARLFVALETGVLHANVKPLPNARDLFAEKIEGRCGEVRTFDLDRAVELERRRGHSTLDGLRIAKGKSALMQIRVLLPGGKGEERHAFDVVQRDGKRIVGGSTYVIRGRRVRVLPEV